MRSDEKRKNRAGQLRRLKKKITYEEIASKADVNASYLSQIANEIIQKNGVKPRSLSDDYAEKIETALGLHPGWFDEPSPESRAEIVKQGVNFDLVKQRGDVQLAVRGGINSDNLPPGIRSELKLQAVDMALRGLEKIRNDPEFDASLSKPEWRARGFNALYKAYFDKNMRKQDPRAILRLVLD